MADDFRKCLALVYLSYVVKFHKLNVVAQARPIFVGAERRINQDTKRLRFDTGNHEGRNGHTKVLYGMVSYRHEKTHDDTNLELLFYLNYFWIFDVVCAVNKIDPQLLSAVGIKKKIL